MRASTITASLALLLTPISARALAVNSTYSWSVTGWTAGCARGGCYYDFNVTGVETTEYSTVIPAFEAYCNGGQSETFTQCKIIDTDGGERGVAAKLKALNETDPGAHVAVSYEFTLESAGSTYNYTGYATSDFNQVSAPPESFTITPTEAWGTA